MVNPDSPLSGVLHGPAKLPSGIMVDGDGANAALSVEKRAALATAKRGRGRLLALDARALLGSAEFQADLKEGIRWLLSQET